MYIDELQNRQLDFVIMHMVNKTINNNLLYKLYRLLLNTGTLVMLDFSM